MVEKPLDPPREWDCANGWHEWKKEVYESAGIEFYRCKICGICEEDLEEED